MYTQAATLTPGSPLAEIAEPVVKLAPRTDSTRSEVAAIADRRASLDPVSPYDLVWEVAVIADRKASVLRTESTTDVVVTTEGAPESQGQDFDAQPDTIDPWAGVRQCESGGNYSINTGNGFFGAYQFTLSTWDWVAGIVGREDLVGLRPDLAAPADQDSLAQSLGFEIAGGGLGHWPVCGAYYGTP